jgi:hypothetical protein
VLEEKLSDIIMATGWASMGLGMGSLFYQVGRTLVVKAERLLSRKDGNIVTEYKKA